MRDLINRTANIIFSVTRPTWKGTVREELNNQDARNRLDSLKIPYKEVQGCYRGEIEQAFIVDARHKAAVSEIAREYNQECILHLDEDRHGHYLYLTDSVGGEAAADYAGKFVKTTKERAAKQEGYTYDPIEDQYWILTGVR